MADVCSSELGFEIRERRLLLIGLLVGLGKEDVLDIQLASALKRGELDAAQLRELVIFFAHYAGWPAAATLNTRVEKLIAGQQKPESGSQSSRRVMLRRRASVVVMPSAAARTEATCCSGRNRVTGPVTLTAASACSFASRTGAATQTIPGADSSCSKATPSRTTRRSSSRSSPGAMIVRGVWRCRPAATTRSSRSLGAYASRALPSPVQ